MSSTEDGRKTAKGYSRTILPKSVEAAFNVTESERSLLAINREESFLEGKAVVDANPCLEGRTADNNLPMTINVRMKWKEIPKLSSISK